MNNEEFENLNIGFHSPGTFYLLFVYIIYNHVSLVCFVSVINEKEIPETNIGWWK